MRQTVTVVCLLFLSLGTIGQQIKGQTLNEQGEPLPFATIHIKGTTQGTTSNTNGFYQLRLSPGEYTLVAKHVGYQRTEFPIVVASQPIQKDLILPAETVQLNEVVVRSGGEDPAYRVIRAAIERRRFYEKEVDGYSCDVYIKGLQRVDTFPKKILGIQMVLDTGIVYLSESVSKLKFLRPDRVKETMISSKVSGNNRAFSWNMASEMLVNMYQNTFYLEDLSERPFVSPIANNALLFYDYSLEGVIQEDGELINKIKLLPKRRNDPVFEGYLYIVENSWRIQSVDALLTKNRGIEFIDSLQITQVYNPAGKGIWMPMSQRFSFSFNVLKIKGSGHFNAVYSNYDLQPNYALISATTGSEQPPIQLFSKKDFDMEILKVEDDANEKDSLYWENIRPIPLTMDEIRDYTMKDSIRKVKESEWYRDSIDTERNRLSVGKVLITGYTRHHSYVHRRLNFRPLINSAQYNTVEGAALELRVNHQWMDKDDRPVWALSPSLRYGFSNEKFHAEATVGRYLKDQKETRIQLSGGRYISQLNGRLPLSPFANTFSALFFGESPMRLFERGYVKADFRQELVNGLFLNVQLSYANRNELFNTSAYAIIPESRWNFESNQPFNFELADTARFKQHQLLALDLSLRIRFDQKYITRPDRKIRQAPQAPEVYLRYRKGFPWLGSDLSFDYWEIELRDRIKIGLVGTSEYHVSTGGFFNKSELTFLDFKHFNGNRLNFTRINKLVTFQLLDYYTFSTTGKFLEVHYDHHFNEFILNKIPLIRQLDWQSVFSLNYLHTRDLNHYVELGFGIEHIFKIVRIDYFTKFSDGQLMTEFPQRGIRIGIGF